ncbi:MAG: 2-amino-4-hydroxy-6-hydroxymethyldihydropteridine diphosphokinase [Hyphomicrobiales bacterium]|nr:2-amino-4-hydroxy-6-hydroxymethyldihydropteridine diphosphokinase [Hyphomicrobiales bacterium]MCP5374280.1 2-amino-4-hydroxy-6-hydroxymethyldihydropteridine diphosphokinase [Hyphomicrobiales bacterium]
MGKGGPVFIGPVFIGLGANLDSPVHGPPRATCEAALAALAAAGVRILRRARWYRSAPVPSSDQPWFVNGVAEVAADLAPAELLARLHAVEDAFGRVRRDRDEARVLDLDLLAHGDRVDDGLGNGGAGGGPVLPHPRLHLRAFVLLPLCELAPDWVHPVLGRTARDLAADLPPDQVAEPLE